MSVPGAFGVPPTDDLRLYMRTAELPPMRISSSAMEPACKMPPANLRSHRNKIVVSPGGHRALESIDRLYPSAIDAEQVRRCASSRMLSLLFQETLTRCVRRS
jgi:hypothetical protein